MPHPCKPFQASAGLVLDCGFSFTHAVPIFDGRVVEAGVRRLNLGGKAITNLLKEVLLPKPCAEPLALVSGSSSLDPTLCSCNSFWIISNALCFAK